MERYEKWNLSYLQFDWYNCPYNYLKKGMMLYLTSCDIVIPIFWSLICMVDLQSGSFSYESARPLNLVYLCYKFWLLEGVVHKTVLCSCLWRDLAFNCNFTEMVVRTWWSCWLCRMKRPLLRQHQRLAYNVRHLKLMRYWEHFVLDLRFVLEGPLIFIMNVIDLLISGTKESSKA